MRRAPQVARPSLLLRPHELLSGPLPALLQGRLVASLSPLPPSLTAGLLRAGASAVLSPASHRLEGGLVEGRRDGGLAAARSLEAASVELRSRSSISFGGAAALAELTAAAQAGVLHESLSAGLGDSGAAASAGWGSGGRLGDAMAGEHGTAALWGRLLEGLCGEGATLAGALTAAEAAVPGLRGWLAVVVQESGRGA